MSVVVSAESTKGKVEFSEHKHTKIKTSVLKSNPIEFFVFFNFRSILQAFVQINWSFYFQYIFDIWVSWLYQIFIYIFSQNNFSNKFWSSWYFGTFSDYLVHMIGPWTLIIHQHKYPAAFVSLLLTGIQHQVWLSPVDLQLYQAIVRSKRTCFKFCFKKKTPDWHVFHPVPGTAQLHVYQPLVGCLFLSPQHP